VEGGRIEKEASIHMSNVMPLDADSGKPTRVKAGYTEEDGMWATYDSAFSNEDGNLAISGDFNAYVVE
jgi:ribosomal protein L24